MFGRVLLETSRYPKSGIPAGFEANVAVFAGTLGCAVVFRLQPTPPPPANKLPQPRRLFWSPTSGARTEGYYVLLRYMSYELSSVVHHSHGVQPHADLSLSQAAKLALFCLGETGR